MKPTSSQADNGSTQASSKNRIVLWLISLPVIIFAALMLIGKFMDDPQSKQRWIDRESIKICWKQMDKPEAERKLQEFKSKADCEQMEFDFKNKYRENP